VGKRVLERPTERKPTDLFPCLRHVGKDFRRTLSDIRANPTNTDGSGTVLGGLSLHRRGRRLPPVLLRQQRAASHGQDAAEGKNNEHRSGRESPVRPEAEQGEAAGQAGAAEHQSGSQASPGGGQGGEGKCRQRREQKAMKDPQQRQERLEEGRGQQQG